MNILTAVKSINHIFIICKVGQNTKFNLAVIGVNKGIALARRKEFTHFSAEFGTNRNVLQIRFKRTNTTRSGLHLIKRSMNSAVGVNSL